jgi:hypothetical protein
LSVHVLVCCFFFFFFFFFSDIEAYRGPKRPGRPERDGPRPRKAKRQATLQDTQSRRDNDNDRDRRGSRRVRRGCSDLAAKPPTPHQTKGQPSPDDTPRTPQTEAPTHQPKAPANLAQPPRNTPRKPLRRQYSSNKYNKVVQVQNHPHRKTPPETHEDRKHRCRDTRTPGALKHPNRHRRTQSRPLKQNASQEPSHASPQLTGRQGPLPTLRPSPTGPLGQRPRLGPPLHLDPPLHQDATPSRAPPPPTDPLANRHAVPPARAATANQGAGAAAGPSSERRSASDTGP